MSGDPGYPIVLNAAGKVYVERLSQALKAGKSFQRAVAEASAAVEEERVHAETVARRNRLMALRDSHSEADHVRN